MTTLTGNYVSDNSTIANFKSWAQAISGAFSALGWVQTADTGQVNWSTISTVPSNAYVYEIWKSNDALSSTLPIYIQIQYGFSSSSPKILVTVGTGSSGTGTITGQVITSAPWGITWNNANQGSTTYPCFFSGTSGEFRMWMWGTPTASPNTGVMFVVERSKDSNGNNTASYFTVVATNQANTGTNAGTYQQTILPAGVGNRDYGVICPSFTSGSTTGSAFGTVAALPVFPVYGQVGNPMLGLMAVAIGDAAANSTVTVTSMYGSTHTYLCVGGGGSNGSISSNFGSRSSATTGMAGLMRYE